MCLLCGRSILFVKYHFDSLNKFSIYIKSFYRKDVHIQLAR